MTASTRSAAADLRAAAADLDALAAARAAVAAAEEHLTETIREVRDARRVTVEQIAQVLGLSRRQVYNRLASTRRGTPDLS